MKAKSSRIDRRQLLRLAGLGMTAVVAEQLLSGCAVNPVTGENQLMMVSEGEELQIDRRQSPRQFSNDYGPTQDARLNQYVNQVGREVAARSHRPGMPYSFRVVNAPHINAYAFPGGSIAATRGILAEMENEAELAALFGHEIGHVAARHTAQQASKGMLTNMVLTGATIATSAAGYGAGADLIQNLGGLGAGAYLASYSRDHEREADALGMRYMTAAGYTPAGMVDLMQVLVENNRRRPSALEMMFSTHPMSNERLATARKEVATTYSAYTNQRVNRERYMDETASVRKLKPMLDALQKGSAAMNRKNANEAGRYFQQALQQKPDDYTALLMMAKYRMSVRDNKAAERFARQAMQVYPQEAQAYLVSGVTALNNRNYSAAYQTLTQYDRIMPGNIQVQFYEGYALEKMDRIREASAKYATFLRYQRQGREAQYAYQRLQSWGYVR
ncbi:MAG: M48 family metalloprotease [Desulfobulbus sp.]|jgi:predicted Zn-dependent protease